MYNEPVTGPGPTHSRLCSTSHTIRVLYNRVPGSAASNAALFADITVSGVTMYITVCALVSTSFTSQLITCSVSLVVLQHNIVSSERERETGIASLRDIAVDLTDRV